MRKLIVDIDDTIADIGHRRHLYENKQWDEYNSLIPLDSPIDKSIRLVKVLSVHYYLTILTGRYDRYRNDTVTWLRDNEIEFDELVMKPDNDARSSFYFKIDWIGKNKDDIAAVFDDRRDIIEFCRNLKLITIMPSII